MKLEFWFDFASTYSYPAAMRIQSLAAEADVELVWRPFLLGPIFQQQGLNDSPFNTQPVKGEYMWRDMARVCSDQNIPFNRPSIFPQNGLLSARITKCFANEAWIPDFVRTVYLANFDRNEDISSLDVIERCLVEVGQDAPAILKEATSEASKMLLREQTEEAIARGIFGAPSFLVGDELFWGNDRLTQAIQWAVVAK